MKYLKLKFLLMFFALAMAIPPAWAAEAGFSLASLTTPPIAKNATNLTTTITGNIGDLQETWNVAIEGSLTSSSMQGASGPNKYWQMGKSGGSIEMATFSTSGINGTITKIVVNCANNGGIGGSVSVDVNNQPFADSQSMPAWSNNTGGNVTFTGRASGPISIKMFPTLNKACYIQSITVTYEEGATGQTDPWINVTPDPLNIDDDGGVFTVSAANMPNNGLGALVDSSSPSNEFSFSKTNDNTFNDGDKYFPLTGNSNQLFDLESGTVQVNYTGHALSAAGVIKFASGSESATADVNYLYDGDIYIVGNVNEYSWDEPVAGVKMTKKADGTYYAEITANNGGDGNAYLYFTKKVGAANYDTQSGRFGPAGDDGNWSYNSGLNGVYCDLDTEGNLHTIKMAPGNYIFTIDPANNKFKIEAVAGPKIYNKVTHESQLIAGKKYILVYEATPAFLGGISTTSTNYGISITGPTLEDNSVNIGQYSDIRELTLSGDASGWSFHNGDGYLTWTSGNSLNVADEISDNAKWTVTSDFALLNVSNSNRKLLYNTSPVRFACYDLTNTNIKTYGVLYVEDGVEPVLPAVEAPTILPAEREFDSSVEVSMTCATAGATIYYTTDGTDPTATTGTVYNQPFTLNTTTTVKAIAVLGNETSTVVTATFTKTGIETIAKAQALPTSGANANFTFVGSAVVTFHNGNHLYIRDASGSGLIYGVDAATKKYNNGDVLTAGWKAKNDVYQVHTPEFTNPTGVGSTANNGTVAPEMLPSIQLTDVNKYAGFNNVTIKSANDQNYYIEIDGVDYCLRRAYTDLVGELTVGKKYNVTGVVTIYRSGSSSNYTYTPQLNLITATPVKEDLTLGFYPASVEQFVGQAFTAPALTGVPEGETIDVTYSSNNTNVATVVDNVVTLVEGATGTAIITATFAGNDYYNPTTATYTITVNEKLAHGMSFSAETLNVTYGDEDYEAPTLNNPNSLTVTYESDNEDVAVVDENTGELLLGDAGTAVITAKTKGDASHNGGSVSYTVNIAKAAAGLAYETAQYTVYAGQDFEAPTLTNPNKLTVTYESDNEDVAVVDETGDVLIGEKVGDAKITAKFEGNKNYEAGSASYTIHVIAKDNVTMSFDPTSVTLYVDEEFAQPTLTTNPANLPVKYSSDNEEVAMVDETSGEVLLMEKAGTATITAKYAGNDQYNEASATYTITVENRPEILIDDESLDLGTTGEGEIFVMASDLKENVTVTSSNENFKVEPPTITPEQAANGVNVTVTYTGNNPEGESTTITFSTKDGEDVKVTVTAKAETYVALAAPTFSLVAGTYGKAQQLYITAESGANILYSTDGSEPTTPYNGAIDLGQGTTTVKAVATKDGFAKSPVVTATYIIDIPEELPTITPFKGYFQIKNNGNGKYANIAGRKTLNFTDAENAKKMAGTVIWLETNDKGQVQSIRSQAADLQGYANRAMRYVPQMVDIVVNKINQMEGIEDATGAGSVLGENGLKEIMAKFNECFDYHLYVEQAQGGWRLYGKTPNMQHVVDFYRDHKDQVEAKLPKLEQFINDALHKLINKIGGSTVFTDFSLHQIWKNMGGTLTEPVDEDEASIMAFYREVLNNKNYVWDFAYQTAQIYWGNVKSHPRYEELKAQLGEYADYIDEFVTQVRPDFKYYVIQRGDEPDYISEGNGEIINNDPRTIWTLEPRTDFTVNIAGEQFGCPYAGGVGGYATTNYTDFAYTVPEGVTAYKVASVENGVANLQALSGVIPAQTPVLLMAKTAGDYVLKLSTEAGTKVTGNLLVGVDSLITRFQLKTPMVESLFSLAKGVLGEQLYNQYVAQYEYLQLLYAGTVNNKYFWGLTRDDVMKCLNANGDDCVVRDLSGSKFIDNRQVKTNKAFLVSETDQTITISTLRGDVNHDGYVNIDDVTALIDYMLEVDGRACPYCANVNCDSTVNIVDVTYLIDILLGNISPYAEGGNGN